MIRFGVVLSVVVAALGLLVGGILASSLPLVYLSIGVAALAGLLLCIGVVIWRKEIFGAAVPARAAASDRSAGPVASDVESAVRPVPVVTAQAAVTAGQIGGSQAPPGAAADPPLTTDPPAGVPPGPPPIPAAPASEVRLSRGEQDRPDGDAGRAGTESGRAAADAVPAAGGAGDALTEGRPAISDVVSSDRDVTLSVHEPESPRDDAVPDGTESGQAASDADRSGGDAGPGSEAGPSGDAGPSSRGGGHPAASADPGSGAGQAGPAVPAPGRTASAGGRQGAAGGQGPTSGAGDGHGAASSTGEANGAASGGRGAVPDGQRFGAGRAAAAAVARAGRPAAGERARTAVSGAPRLVQPAAGSDVTIVPGIARYHLAECILIRFLGPDDLRTILASEAVADGCVPCRACQPDNAAAASVTD